MRSRLGLALLTSLAACGPSTVTPPDAGVACEAEDNPTFELGTGESAFASIVDGQDLDMVPGPQGGCHFWLAVRTRGFPGRGTKLRYEVVFADTGTTTQSFSSFQIGLEPVEGETGVCEHYGTTGFLIEPWKFVDREVEIQAKVWWEPRPGQEIASMDSRNVVGRWPAGGDDSACGIRD